MKAPPKAGINRLLAPLDQWGGKCHQASLEIVRSGLLPDTARVARGWADGVASQHSWVIIDGDCFDPGARIIDPTLWGYRVDVKGVWYGTAAAGIHHPHGEGSIWEFGRPAPPTEPPITLRPATPLSATATRFLRLLGPLDRAGWGTLASRCPVGDWPAGEIIAAMDNTPGLTALVPIDRLGMLTDLNPAGMYR